MSRCRPTCPLGVNFVAYLLNIVMSNSSIFTPPAWPNDIGPWRASWQCVEVICDWSDMDLVFEAICDLNSYNATPTYSVVANFECADDPDMVHFCLAYDNPEDIDWDEQERVGLLDPCNDPEALDQWIGSVCPRVWLSMGTIFEIDMRDEATYRQFLAGCEERLSQLRGQLPQIKFMVR
jgi:hypothetical protein